MSETTTTTTTIVDFLLARIAEDEATTMTTIVDFLLARIAEDEATAMAAAAGEALLPSLRSVKASAWVPDGEITHIVRWDPARVLAECEAKRRIVEMHATRAVRYDYDNTVTHLGFGCLECGELGDEFDACPTIRTLVAVDADHPDYQQEWRL